MRGIKSEENKKDCREKFSTIPDLMLLNNYGFKIDHFRPI